MERYVGRYIGRHYNESVMCVCRGRCVCTYISVGYEFEGEAITNELCDVNI